MKKCVLIFSLLNWESKLLHREHMLAKYFNKKGFSVYYIQKENVRSISQLKFKPRIYKDGDIHIVSISAFPYMKGKVDFIYKLNDQIIKKQLKEVFSIFDHPLMIVESPYWVKGIEEARDGKGIICYDISDDLAQFATNEKWKNKLFAYEELAIEKSDIVFITCDELRHKVKNRKPVYVVANGVDLDQFSNSRPILKKDFEGYICGFIGGIFDWIDFDLIDKLAKYYKDFNFVLIGPTNQNEKMEDLCRNSNVYYLGEKDKNEIGDYYSSFDIGLIPFVSEERYPRLKTVNSNKVFQYSYFGYPILSTSFEQVRILKDFVEVSESQDEFIEKLKLCLNENTAQLQNKRKQYAIQNSWETKVEEMIRAVEKI